MEWNRELKETVLILRKGLDGETTSFLFSSNDSPKDYPLPVKGIIGLKGWE
jgi:hypothetical protein